MSPGKPLTLRDIRAAQLVTAATRHLEEGGPGAIHARSVAAEVGLTTQALYSTYGGLDRLLDAVAARGFTDLATHVASMPSMGDPMTDLMTALLAHAGWAVHHPRLYRHMYTTTSPALSERLDPDPIEDAPSGPKLYNTYIHLINNCIEADRIRNLDPSYALRQLLSAVHGWAMLQTAGDLGCNVGADLLILGDLLSNIAIGLGESPTGQPGQ